MNFLPLLIELTLFFEPFGFERMNAPSPSGFPLNFLPIFQAFCRCCFLERCIGLPLRSRFPPTDPPIEIFGTVRFPNQFAL